MSDVCELMRDLLGLDDTTPTNSKGKKALLQINYLSCVLGCHIRKITELRHRTFPVLIYILS
jgi:hypothetical protein